MLNSKHASRFILLLVSLAFFSSCRSENKDVSTTKPASSPVVVYCSVDRAFAEPLLKELSESSGLDIRPIFDSEAGKTTGLLNRLLAERDRPRADVWWSSEIFGTIDLAAKGVFDAYKPETANDIPEQFVDKDHLWTAFGLRGRVVAYDSKRTLTEDAPKRWIDLADEKYRGHVAMADPRFGTTRGHVAAMLTMWGEKRFGEFLTGLKENKTLAAQGNSHAVILMARDEVDFAATDTDDVIVAQARGDSVAEIYPSMGIDDQSIGTLWIPCSVALVRGARNPNGAKKVIDLIASSEMESALYKSESRNVPVRPKLRDSLGIDAPVIADVNYADVAANLDNSQKMFEDAGVFD